MKLITRKSECRRTNNNMLVKSQKEAIRKTLSNYEVKDGYILKAYLPSYVSKEALVLRKIVEYNEFSIRLDNTSSLANMSN